MVDVWFRCNRKHDNVFVLNSKQKLETVPIVGDKIKVSEKDFIKATFRVKPYFKDKKQKSLKNVVALEFTVKNRCYDIRFSEWELICEPTPESLLLLLKRLKVH